MSLVPPRVILSVPFIKLWLAATSLAVNIPEKMLHQATVLLIIDKALAATEPFLLLFIPFNHTQGYPTCLHLRSGPAPSTLAHAPLNSFLQQSCSNKKVYPYLTQLAMSSILSITMRLTLLAAAFQLVLACHHPSNYSPTYLAILPTDLISSLTPRVVMRLCRLPTTCLTQVSSSSGRDGQSPGSRWRLMLGSRVRQRAVERMNVRLDERE